FFVGQTDDGRFFYPGTAIQYFLDLARIDVLAAGDDHIVDAAAKIKKSLGILADEIARVEPAVAQFSRRLDGIVPVSPRDVRTADDQLPDFARRDDLVGACVVLGPMSDDAASRDQRRLAA